MCSAISIPNNLSSSKLVAAAMMSFLSSVVEIAAVRVSATRVTAAVSDLVGIAS